MATEKQKRNARYMREYRKKNCDKMRQQGRERYARDGNLPQRICREYLQSHPCISCGNDDLRVLQFHHRDPDTKLFSVRTGCHSGQAVVDEIAKCDVLCANCHCILHAMKTAAYR